MNLDSSAAYRSLIEHSSDIITLLDEDGLILYQSPSSERILGYEDDDLLGENAFAYIHPEDRERARATFAEVVGSPGARTERAEFRFERADGTWQWLESTTSNCTDTALDGYVVNSRDIGTRKARERALEEERAKYETLVERSHDGVAIVQQGRFVFANERFADLLGAESEVVGRSFSGVVAPPDRESVQARYERRVGPEAADPPSRYRINFLTDGGEARVGEISVADIQYGGAPAVLVTVRDVTEQTEYRERLERLTDELEALNRLLRHDVLNDMHVIMAWAERLEAHVDDAGQASLAKLQRSADHIVELTRNAREFVETLTADDEMACTPVRLDQILENELELRRESFPEASFEVPRDLPATPVVANEMLGSVFRNLLNNAVQHHDGETPHVRVTCDVDEDVVRVRVADDGPGVPDERKEAIFGKGDRDLDSAGTGIGLYLVDALVTQYGGEVRVEDNEPRGAVFVVELPRAG
ncbi:MAG: PAS domain S-box protein [Haloglomus sp.]